MPFKWTPQIPICTSLCASLIAGNVDNVSDHPPFTSMTPVSRTVRIKCKMIYIACLYTYCLVTANRINLMQNAEEEKIKRKV